MLMTLVTTKRAATEADRLAKGIGRVEREALLGSRGVVRLAKDNLLHNNSMASWELYRGVHGEVRVDGDVRQCIVAMPYYGQFLETGTKPGYWPPLRRILRWVTEKGLVSRYSGEVFIGKGRIRRRDSGSSGWAKALRGDFSSARDRLIEGQATGYVNGRPYGRGRRRQDRMNTELRNGGINLRRGSGIRLTGTERRELQLAKAIRFGIHEKGTEPHPWLGAAVVDGQRIYEQGLNALLRGRG